MMNFLSYVENNDVKEELSERRLLNVDSVET
eukprot:UN15833